MKLLLLVVSVYVTVVDSGVESIVSKSSDTCCIGDELILQLASVGIEVSLWLSVICCCLSVNAFEGI